MKQILMMVLSGILMMGFSCSTIAQENKNDLADVMTKGMQEVSKMCQQGKMKGKGDFPDMLMGKSLVATADGGVVVLLGNKLYKYDKDLVLQKEVEIKIDTESAQKKMGKHPMGGNMKMEGESPDATMSPHSSGQ